MVGLRSFLWFLPVFGACASVDPARPVEPELAQRGPSEVSEELALGDVYEGMIRQFVVGEESIQRSYASIREKIAQSVDPETALKWQAVLERMQRAERDGRTGNLQAFEFWARVAEQWDDLRRLDADEFLETLRGMDAGGRIGAFRPQAAPQAGAE